MSTAIKPNLTTNNNHSKEKHPKIGPSNDINNNNNNGDELCKTIPIDQSWKRFLFLYFIGTIIMALSVYHIVQIDDINYSYNILNIQKTKTSTSKPLSHEHYSEQSPPSPLLETKTDPKRTQELEEKIVKAVDLLSLAAKSIVKNKPFVDYIDTKTTLHQMNRNMLLPLLKSLTTLDYFRYVKVNLNRPCKLWCDTDKCNLRDCKVKLLGELDKCSLPTTQDNDNNQNDQSIDSVSGTGTQEQDKDLGIVNTELDSEQLNLLIKLFECNDSDDHDAKYVDLLINPERYTGYKGESANRIWRAIYEENCFIRKTKNPFSPDLCYEERLFYEAISGLHSSINIHLCAEYPSLDLIGSFEPNLDEFLRRFSGHNDYIENLYTLFLLELKALAVSQPYLLKRVKWPEPSTKEAVQDLLKMVNRIEMPASLDLSLKPSHISHELAHHFRNITTTIIDCVACDKCKLWGKVQLRGLGTAFKILSIKDMRQLNLDHQEIVSLINAIARLSHSIRQLETFKGLISKRSNNSKNNNNIINNFDISNKL